MSHKSNQLSIFCSILVFFARNVMQCMSLAFISFFPKTNSLWIKGFYFQMVIGLLIMSGEGFYFIFLVFDHGRVDRDQAIKLPQPNKCVLFTLWYSLLLLTHIWGCCVVAKFWSYTVQKKEQKNFC